MLKLNERFRGYLPIVIDIETAGFCPKTNAMLEIAAVVIGEQDGQLVGIEEFQANIEPFEGSVLDPKALEFNKIKVHSPLRNEQKEKDALGEMLNMVRRNVKAAGCTRAVIVAHNANFDYQFLRAAIDRINFKRDPFHPFTTFDTATLGALAYKETVLAKACMKAGIAYDGKLAHSALYDAQITSELFCKICNTWDNFQIED